MSTQYAYIPRGFYQPFRPVLVLPEVREELKKRNYADDVRRRHERIIDDTAAFLEACHHRAVENKAIDRKERDDFARKMRGFTFTWPTLRRRRGTAAPPTSPARRPGIWRCRACSRRAKRGD